MSYDRTRRACYMGFVVQAIVNNLAPLLFVSFQRRLGLSFGLIGLLATLNFAIQMIVDILSAALADRLGCRPMILAAHVLAALGLVGLSVFPLFMPAYAGILLAVALYAVGGGLLEVMLSPVLEALPSGDKAAAMSLLHSFYCWGHVAVVLLSTLFFALAGEERWRLLPLLWAIVPIVNLCAFARAPMLRLGGEAPSAPRRELFKRKEFWLFFALMVCAGASEQGMSQWASAFAEAGLGVSKSLGDLFGPCFFAVMMGLSRTYYGAKGEKLDLRRFLGLCAVLCMAAYAIAALSPLPAASLLGCGLCGLAVGIMWPGTLSLSSRGLPRGGTAMFALLALGGDVGCSLGPSVVSLAGDLRVGLLLCAGFPLALLVLTAASGRRE